MQPDISIDIKRLDQLKSVSSEARIKVLTWLKTPSRHFPDQVTGDADEIGVCVTLIARKLNVSQPTASRHLDVLKRAGLVYADRVQSWSFYKRHEEEIARFRSWVSTI